MKREPFSDSEVRISKSTVCCLMCGHQFGLNDKAYSVEHGYVCHESTTEDCWSEYVDYITQKVEIDFSEEDRMSPTYEIVRGRVG